MHLFCYFLFFWISSLLFSYLCLGIPAMWYQISWVTLKSLEMFSLQILIRTSMSFNNQPLLAEPYDQLYDGIPYWSCLFVHPLTPAGKRFVVTRAPPPLTTTVQVNMHIWMHQLELMLSSSASSARFIYYPPLKMMTGWGIWDKSVQTWKRSAYLIWRRWIPPSHLHRGRNSSMSLVSSRPDSATGVCTFPPLYIRTL